MIHESNSSKIRSVSLVLLIFIGVIFSSAGQCQTAPTGASPDSISSVATQDSQNSESIDLGQLLPRFTLLFGGPNESMPNSGKDKNLRGKRLSAFFVGILILLFGAFLIIVCYKFWKSYSATKWTYHLIKEKDADSIVSTRDELVQISKESKSAGAHLWLEFDESLIEVTVGDKTRVFNTLDASHFFNPNTLASGVSNNRLLAAVPGFLTALGVVGTFIGLQLGLAGLKIGEESTTTEIQSGLAVVISGAKIAFITSVWGVSLSVIFNVIEKSLEGFIRGKIEALQIKVDEVFPRLSAEFQLQQIAEDGHQSRESLQGLAEKIGSKMQESLLAATSNIEAALVQALEAIMKPAIDNLVDNTSESSQKAMDALMERFLNKFGEGGESQKQALQAASQQLTGGLSDLSGSMGSFLEQLSESEKFAAEREKKWSEELTIQLKEVVSQNEGQRRHLTEFVEERFNKLVDVLEGTQVAAIRRDQERAEIVDQQTENMVSVTGKLMGQVKSSLDDQLTASGLIIEQGKSLQQSISDSVMISSQANKSLHAAATELGLTVERLSQFGSVLSRDIGEFGASLKSASKEIEQAAGRNQETTDILQRLGGTISEAQASAQQAVEELNRLIGSANNSFSTMRGHQDEFLASLKNNVSELAHEMTNLLGDYAERANSQTTEHLDIWAKHTTQYAETMNNAVRALSSVVDDIEDRMNH